MTTEIQPVALTRKLGSDELGWYVFDAVFEESHQSDLEVTDNPVETGVVVSDHAYMKPLQLTLSAGVSDTPLDGYGGGYQVVDGALSGGKFDFWSRSAPNDKFASDSGRAKRAFELLTELQRKAEPFDVQTGLKLYQNMICTSIRTKQDKDTANVLVFEATLREVLIVNTRSVKYTPKAKKGATNRQTTPKQNAGEQQIKQAEASGSAAAKVKTSLQNLFGGGKK